MDTVLWGVVLRLTQTFINAAPWIAIGFVIAGVFRVVVGPQKTRNVFGGNSWKGLVYGWLWGMLLPVCSLGVIPIVRELYRSGVRGGTLIAFALTAPLFNPLSVLYGLTLSDPVAIITFAFCSLVIVSSVGLVWDMIFKNSNRIDEKEISDETVAIGIRRSVATFKASTQMIFSSSALYILIGIVGSVAVNVVLPHGAMSSMLERDNSFAPLVVAGLGIPVYSTPLLAMSQIGSMFQHGNSIGAAFCLLIFGAGVNVGLFVCFLRLYGLGKLAAFIGLLLFVSVGLAYLIGEPLYPEGVEVAGHTHAFDIYTSPFPTKMDDAGHVTRLEVQKHWTNHEFGGTPILIVMTIIGAIFFLLEKSTGLNQWLASKPDKEKQMDKVLPGWLVTSLTIAGLLLFSVAGCYLYYPAKEEALEQMTTFNIEAVAAANTGNWEGAMKWIEFQQDLARRLEVGSFIRSGELSEYHRTKARILRENLELLKHEVEDQDKERASELALKTNRSFLRLKRAFLDDAQ